VDFITKKSIHICNIGGGWVTQRDSINIQDIQSRKTINIMCINTMNKKI